MLSFMSDRRVLAASAAVITLAIMAFLVATFPHWRAAMVPDQPSAPPTLAALPAMGAGSDTAKPMKPDTKAVGFAAPAPSAASDASARMDAPTPKPAAAPTSVASGESSPAALADAAATVASPNPALTETGGTAGKPSFDVVRVEPSGDSVVAARAAPGAEIVLLDQGQPIAHAKADASGQVAFVPPALAPGDHSLMLSVGDPKNPASLSSQSVAVTVPAQGKGAPLVALIAPDQPTRILSGAGAPPASTPGAAQGPGPSVAVSSIDVEELGSVFATGRAAPDSHCRVYLNGSFIASVTAGKDGNWSLKIQRGMRPGRYSVRVDQVQPASGQVQARAEVPFDYPAQVASGASLFRPKPGRAPGDRTAVGAILPLPTGSGAAGKGTTHVSGIGGSPSVLSAGSPEQMAAAQPTVTTDATLGDGSDAVVAQLLTTKVVHGDSLWRISRKMLGHGVRYTQIYAANSTQIRDPKLIYPGQIFVMPQAQ